jgi:FAD/FMN-containing dehydrogenase
MQLRMNRRGFIKLCALSGMGPWIASAIPVGGPRLADWTALARGLTGKLVLPQNDEYGVARRVFNPRFDSILPAAIAFCRNPDDVRECLAFVRSNRISVRLRSGGHSYGGWSTGSGLVLDVSAMNDVAVGDSQTAVTGAGARLIDMYDALARHGVTVPCGSCPSVGVAGITLGGGVGMLSRPYGLTCDNLLSIVVVLADGRILTCDSHHNSDLYWACRGGGGGNFGVATRFTFRTHPTTETIRVLLEWSWADAARVIRAWQHWGPGAPDQLGSYCQLRTDARGGTPLVRVLVLFLGSEAELEPLVNELVAAVGTEPTRSGGTESFMTSMLALAGCSTESVEECRLVPQGEVERVAFAAKSDFFSRPLSSAGVATLVHYIGQAQALEQLSNARVTLDALGGAVARVRPGETAFVHRSALFDAQYAVYLPERSFEGATAQGLHWLREFHQAMQPHTTGGAYVNYADPELGDWKRAYYGSNYPRLQRIKAKYDPRLTFRFPQAIGG